MKNENLSVERIRLEEVAHIANLVKRAAEICDFKASLALSGSYAIALDYSAKAVAYRNLHEWLTTGTTSNEVLMQVETEAEKGILPAPVPPSNS